MKTTNAFISRILTLSLIAGSSIVFSGAGCPGPGVDDGGDDLVSIRFAFPREGDVLNQADDGDGDTSNGIQVDPPIRVAYEGDVGATITLTSSEGETATALVDDDGFARFTGFTLPGTAAGLAITLTAADDTGVEDSIDIETVINAPVVTCSITTPSDGATFSLADDSSADNGFQIELNVTCQNLATGTVVDVDVEGNASTMTLGATGSATATITLPNADAPPNNSNTISISVSEGGSVIAGTTDSATVSILSVMPMIDLTAPTDGAVFGPADDLDNDASNGVSLALQGTISNATTANYVLDCSDDGSDQNGTMTDGAFDEVLANLAFSPTNTCTLRVDAIDGAGQTALVEVSFTVSEISIDVDFAGCDTDANGYLVASEDEDTGSAATMDCGVDVTATFAAGTWTGSAEIYDLGADLADAADDTLVGAAIDLGTLTSGTVVVVPLAVPFADETSYEVRVTVNDGAMDVGPAVGGVIVDTVAPTLAWIAPASMAVINGVTGDQDPAAAGLQIFSSVTATGLPTGSSVAMVFTGPATVNTTCATNGNGFCNLSNTTLADGAWNATADVTDAAGNGATTAIVAFTTDGSAPAVLLPINENIQVADDEAGDDNGTLNLAEAGDGEGVATSDVIVNFDSATPLEDGQTVTLTNSGATLATATSTNNSVTFSDVTLPQGALLLGVSANDIAGNPIPNAAPSRSFSVDTASPTITIVSPVAGTLTNDAVAVAVITTAEDGQSVAIFDVTGGGDTELGSSIVTSGGATINVSLAQGAVDIEARVADVAGNPAVDSESYVVDSQAPTLTLTLVSDISIDQDLVTSGFQVDFNVDYAGLEEAPPSSITLASALTMTQIGAASTDGDGQITVRATFAVSGTHPITAAASDAAGNAGVSNEVSVVVATGNWDVFVDQPIPVGSDLFYAAASLPGGLATVIVTVPLFAVGGTVDLLIGGVSEGSQTANRVGDTFTITWSASDGDAASIEISVDGAGQNGTSGVLNYEIDLGLPTVGFTNLVDNTIFNAADDQPATAGLQTTVSIDVTECENGTLTVTEGATTLGTASVAAGGTETVVVIVADLTDHASDTWTATCVDRVGNTNNATVTTEVDTTPPALPTLMLAVIDAQLGEIDVTVTAPGDDGSGGPNATLQVAASPVAVLESGFVALFAQDFHPGVGGPVAETSATAPGASYNVQTARLAFDRDWTIAVSATDNAGNSSFTSLLETGLTTAALTYNHTDDGVSCADDRFAYPASQAGDLNGDGFDDLVLAAPGEGSAGCFLDFDEGAIYIWSGQADLSTLDFSTPDRRLYTPLTYSRGKRLDLGDVNGDGFDDIVIATEDYTTPFNVLLEVFYGQAGPLLVRNTPVVIDFGAGFGTEGIDSLKVIGDVNNDGYDDIYIGPWTLASAVDTQARILFGQSADFNTTLTANTITVLNADSAGSVFIRQATGLGDIDNDTFGDFVLSVRGRGLVVVRGRATANWPATLNLSTVVAPDILQCTNVSCGRELTSGDINGDGFPDIVVSWPGGDEEVRVYLHDGASAYPSTTPYRLQPPGDIIDQKRGGLSVGDINGDGFSDVVVSQQAQNGETAGVTVWLGSDYSALTRTEPDAFYPMTIDFTAAGRMIACGDLDNNGDDELCYSTESGAGTVVVRY